MKHNETLFYRNIKKTLNFAAYYTNHIDMSTLTKTLVLTVVSILLLSCNKDELSNKMEEIKCIGDSEPTIALRMLDSIEVQVRTADKSIQYHYDLLRIRVNDKAEIIPTSDINVQQILRYFEKNGSIAEKQEAYYYAGSVYRDLQDTPRALEYFLLALDCAHDRPDMCDSVILNNTYSNLSYLYYIVQDFNNAEIMAEKELKICNELHKEPIVPYMHVANACLALDSIRRAGEALDSVLEYIYNCSNPKIHTEHIIHLLMYYAQLEDRKNADICRELIGQDERYKEQTLYQMAFAKYFESCNIPDSAIFYYKELVKDENTDILSKYDAAKRLYRLTKKNGKETEIVKYADLYMTISDSLDLGRRQDMAATVNNKYKYHFDKKKETELIKERQRHIFIIIGTSITALICLFALSLFFTIRRNIHLKQFISLSQILNDITTNNDSLRKEICHKNKEIELQKEQVENYCIELNQLKNNLNSLKSELEHYNHEIKNKEQLLSEKIEQNQTLIKLLHQTEPEEHDEDIITTIRHSSKNKKTLSAAEWRQFYCAVDELYPTLNDTLIRGLGHLTEQQIQVHYLLSIGMPHSHISNITGVSRTTIWRWAKKHDNLMSGIKHI